jgi:hypothetical protein
MTNWFYDTDRDAIKAQLEAGRPLKELARQHGVSPFRLMRIARLVKPEDESRCQRCWDGMYHERSIPLFVCSCGHEISTSNTASANRFRKQLIRDGRLHQRKPRKVKA